VSSSSAGQLVAPRPAAARRRVARPATDAAPRLWAWWVWVLVVAAVLATSIWFVHWSGMRPSFDPFGWLAWGHQIVYGRLNLNAAPSWKPLPFIFTVPFALFGGTSVSMWSVTSTAGTIFMGVFAFRIAFRLGRQAIGEDAGRWGLAAVWIGALVAGVGVLGMEGLPKLTYIANSDQLNTALVLAAIDAHVSRRPRLAYVVLFVASLGRPEVWLFSGLYGLWLIWKVPGARTLAVGGWVLILAAWYVPDLIWAKSINQASLLDLNKNTACHTGRVVCVAGRWANLYEWPMQAAALIGVAIGLARRDRAILWMFAASLLWVLVEIAFALHGFSTVYRYLMESAAVMIVIAGYGVSQLLAGLPGLLARRPPRRVLIAAGAIVVVGLAVAEAPFLHVRGFDWKVGADHARAEGVVNRNLSRAVALAGGPKAILACGPVAALNSHQSQLAWAMNLNVAPVLFKPALLKRVHRRMVLFTQDGNGWQVRAYNMPASIAARCARTADVHVA
jgi:hypothetical protein